LNILDEGVREVLVIEVDTSLPAERVIWVLEQVTAWRGQPQAIRLDNGPEFLADRYAHLVRQLRDRPAVFSAGQAESECRC
jgi:putative transposase